MSIGSKVECFLHQTTLAVPGFGRTGNIRGAPRQQQLKANKGWISELAPPNFDSCTHVHARSLRTEVRASLKMHAGVQILPHQLQKEAAFMRQRPSNH